MQSSLSPVGYLLREARRLRTMSQLDLSLVAGVSSRHLSFVETGRSEASREMLLRLAAALGMQLSESNALLQAAGLAPIYRETSLEAPEMKPVQDAVAFILRGHGYNPAFLLNQRYDLLLANKSAAALLVALLGPAKAQSAPRNLLDLMFDSQFLRGKIDNWEEVVLSLVARLQREALSASSRSELWSVVKRVMNSDLPERIKLPGLSEKPRAILPVRFRYGSVRLSLFSTITTFGTPADLTTQHLRIEALFPADEASDVQLKKLCLTEINDPRGQL